MLDRLEYSTDEIEIYENSLYDIQSSMPGEMFISWSIRRIWFILVYVCTGSGKTVPGLLVEFYLY